jgi:hypothetical protein
MSYSVSNSVESTTSQNNADFGISLQAMLCDRAGLDVNDTAAEHFRANYNESYEDELLTICEKIESIIPSKLKKYLTYTDEFMAPGQTTCPHNFLLESGETLSIRTTKTSDRVAPRTLGQAGSAVLTDFFGDLYGGDISTQEDVKKLIYYHIHEIFPDFADYLLKSDYTIFVDKRNPEAPHMVKASELGELTFERSDFTFTRTLSNWRESITLKYRDISVAEIQVHTHRFFKFRFMVSKIPVWMVKVKETTETLGMSAESAICKVFNLKRPESFATRVSPSLERELMPVVRNAFRSMPRAIKHTGSEAGARGENSKCSYDFVLEGNQTMSLKTNKGKMVCPPEVGQPGAETCMHYFKEFFPPTLERVDNRSFKEMVYAHIEDIMPIYLAHLMDSDWLLWIYRDGTGFSQKVIESSKYRSFKWNRELFSYTKPNIEDWNESNTLKYNGVTIGEFQVHSGRVCFKFRFHMPNLLQLLGI